MLQHTLCQIDKRSPFLFLLQVNYIFGFTISFQWVISEALDHIAFLKIWHKGCSAIEMSETQAFCMYYLWEALKECCHELIKWQGHWKFAEEQPSTNFIQGLRVSQIYFENRFCNIQLVKVYVIYNECGWSGSFWTTSHHFGNRKHPRNLSQSWKYRCAWACPYNQGVFFMRNEHETGVKHIIGSTQKITWIRWETLL